MLRFAHIPIGDGSGIACSRCRPPRAETFLPAEQVVREIARVVSEWHAPAGVNVALVGPEPFKHPELPQIVAGAAAQGCERVRLRTDGGALARAGNAAGVLHAGVHQIEVVVLGPDGAVHDRLAGVEGLFHAATSGVHAYLAAGADAGVPVVVTALIRLCKHNVQQLPAIVSSIAQWGVTSVAVEVAPAIEVPSGLAADAFGVAMTSGVWLSGVRHDVAGIDPWGVWESGQWR